MSESADQKKTVGEKTVSVRRFHFSERHLDPSKVMDVEDSVAIESPLEIRIVFGTAGDRKDRSLSITMRTPGDDYQLAAGFLLSEGIIESGDEIDSFEFCGTVGTGETISNQLRVNLSPAVGIDMSKLQRHFYTTSSCGVCGKAALDAVEAQNVLPIESALTVAPALIRSLPDQLRQRQDVFGSTGGLHAAGLFDARSNLLDLREDVGRHNAVDKLIGHQLLVKAETARGAAVMNASILVVSGRASFELVQKALIARIPVMVAVGAPSSLAVELAARFGLTLVGFNTGEKFNVYSKPDRIAAAS